MKENQLRKLPSMETILSNSEVKELYKLYPRNLVKEAVNDLLVKIRLDSKTNLRLDISLPSIIYEVQQFLSKKKIRKVLNGTGVLLHTNLGRSPLPMISCVKVLEVMSSYSNLEYNLFSGERGSRLEYIEYLITKLTGGESAFVVNNNAGAVLLVLSAFCQDKEVIVSRGELVEIGGSFRVPDIMMQSSAKLVEVGTTNITRLSDYAQAINEKTAALLKVHPSNFSIKGFTEQVDLKELTRLGREKNLITIEDLGSGLLKNYFKELLKPEPTVEDSLKAEVDLVLFSGDKLLGGPQCGIIIGKKHLIKRIEQHPLSRALRIDKMTVAALEAVLELYFDESRPLLESPLFRMLLMDISELRKRVGYILKKVKNKKYLETIEGVSTTGGGSLPDCAIPTILITVKKEGKTAEELSRYFRDSNPPLIGTINNDTFTIDLRTILETQDEELVTLLNGV
ncbi:MAG: L-seryl-tRNA(Sec) selenium transferase [candidate division WS2 bacterium]|uniref:L-seryl-tRNA(Sec) selenium transferase n=1 Tax=Psychracetigena formicireducens TaxID=2986056 RepID=A0A9E2BFB0_PSYF1|nr:L-seryl-tRNA(Sec) selenium transferase [Candidatus Psychracetigena formicireducens]